MQVAFTATELFHIAQSVSDSLLPQKPLTDFYQQHVSFSFFWETNLPLKISTKGSWCPVLKKVADYDEEAVHGVEDLRNFVEARGVAGSSIPHMHGFSN